MIKFGSGVVFTSMYLPVFVVIWYVMGNCFGDIVQPVHPYLSPPSFIPTSLLPPRVLMFIKNSFQGVVPRCKTTHEADSGHHQRTSGLCGLSGKAYM